MRAYLTVRERAWERVKKSFLYVVGYKGISGDVTLGVNVVAYQ